MDYKPKDLFLSAIDILAIFFPGAILLLLRLEQVTDLLVKILDVKKEGAAFWVAFVVVAYLVGQVLIALTIVFDPLENAFHSRKFWNERLYQYVKEHIPHPDKEELSRRGYFYRAYSYIRLYSPSALEEIEKQTADNKLFRSLTLVCIVDMVVSLVLQQWLRLGIGLAMMVFCLWRFLYLRGFTEMIAYEYYYLLHLKEKQGEQGASRSYGGEGEPE